MLDKILNILDRNKPWKVFRHGSSFVSLLKIVGVWPYIIAVATSIGATVMTWITSAPIWVRVLTGIAVAVLGWMLFLMTAVALAVQRQRKGKLVLPDERSGGHDAMTVDEQTLQALQSTFPSSAVAALRVQQFWTTFEWKFDPVLKAFCKWGLVPENRFLNTELEEIHARLREMAYTLLDRVHRYTDQLTPDSDRRGFTPLGPTFDIAEHESHRNEVWTTATKVCEIYDELITNCRRIFSGTSGSRRHEGNALHIEAAAGTSTTLTTAGEKFVFTSGPVLTSSPVTGLSADQNPDLELVTWHAGKRGRLPSFWPDSESNPTWISVRNTRIAPPLRARNVTAYLEFVNSSRTRRLIVPEAVWFEEQHTERRVSEQFTHSVEIEGGDEQSFILFSENKRGDLIPYKNGSEPLEPLDFDHWDLLVRVSSDNASGCEAHSGFTLTRHSLAQDTPHFSKRQPVPPKIQPPSLQSPESTTHAS
jgi:hypothetical protein